MVFSRTVNLREFSQFSESSCGFPIFSKWFLLFFVQKLSSQPSFVSQEELLYMYVRIQYIHGRDEFRVLLHCHLALDHPLPTPIVSLYDIINYRPVNFFRIVCFKIVFLDNLI